MADTREFWSSSNWVRIGTRDWLTGMMRSGPGDAKRNQVRHILKVANEHFEDLMELWEEAHA
jgi:predicted LPLAT superfamily acyltransferase